MSQNAVAETSLPVFLLKRLLWMALTVWIVFTVSFALMRAVPGGPFDRERKVAEHVKANLERRYNLDRPLAVQYVHELWNYAWRWEFGYSLRMGDFTVNEVIAQGLPVSAALGLLALGYALVVGVLVGVASATWRDSACDVGLRMAATLGIAVPNFVLASVCVLLFVFWLPLLPAAGWEGPRSLVLPVVCLGSPFAAYIARLVRTGMLDVLGQDFIRTALAKGLPHRTVIFKHALRGALLPVVSFLGPATAGVLTGSPVVEMVFRIPGLGFHFVKSAEQRDYTLALALVVLYTLLLYTMNTVVDVLYRFLDPRVKLE